MIFKLRTLDIWILATILKQGEVYSLQVCEETKLKRSSVYNSLKKLTRLGYLKTKSEKGTMQELGRPPRTYYLIKKPKIQSLKGILEDFASVLDFGNMES